ncbi:hypothetical protein BDI24065_05375 [Burkholderia diffusa]|uniref:Uncharacterized protein n=1 Tax=Burkholderia diffusa TaxID=488732 RepID=A0A6P2PS19_9BURK|nr:hypothetical protein BDI24065_05375 [Burkholderia diffusa]
MQALDGPHFRIAVCVRPMEFFVRKDGGLMEVAKG